MNVNAITTFELRPVGNNTSITAAKNNTNTA